MPSSPPNNPTPQGVTDCQPGTFFFACQFNSFSGCCHLDPCNLADGCPGSTHTASTSAETTATTRHAAGVTTIPSPDRVTSTDGVGALPTSTNGGGGEHQGIGASEGGQLAGGVVAGVVLGSAATLLLLCACLVFLIAHRRRRRRRHHQHLASNSQHATVKVPSAPPTRTSSSYSIFHRASRQQQHRLSHNTPISPHPFRGGDDAGGNTSPIEWAPSLDPFAEVGGRADARPQNRPVSVFHLVASASSSAHYSVSPLGTAPDAEAGTEGAAAELEAEVPPQCLEEWWASVARQAVEAEARRGAERERERERGGRAAAVGRDVLSRL